MKHVMCAALVVQLAGCWSVAELGDDKGALELTSGDVVKVVELRKADELVVEKNHHQATVRLLGVVSFDEEIDDAALAQWRQAARQHLEASALRKEVAVALGSTPKDSGGRYLGYLSLGDRDVAKSMVSEGLAIVYTEYGFDRERDYLAAEAEARRGGKGLWSQSAPAQVAKGLRVQWAQFRRERTGQDVSDPLLVPTEPPAAVTPAATPGSQ